MKVVFTRDGYVKSRENTGKTFNDEAAIKFLASIMEKKKELKAAN